jgi:hypothetical protein
MDRFSFPSEEDAKAALYDAAMLILTADSRISLGPISIATVGELSELCRRVEQGEKLSRSPLIAM